MSKPDINSALAVGRVFSNPSIKAGCRTDKQDLADQLEALVKQVSNLSPLLINISARLEALEDKLNKQMSYRWKNTNQ